MTAFDVRSGITGYCAPYDPASVKLLTKGRIRLTASKTRSAGLMGPQIDGPCSIAVEVSGRLHALHPLAVFAVWLYDDATANELDLIEATWWGDPNSPYLYHLTEYEKGEKVQNARIYGRSFDRHRITCEIREGKAVVRLFGWQFDKWLDLGAFSSPFRPGQLRIGLWTHQGINDALGPCSVMLEKVDVSPASVIQ